MAEHSVYRGPSGPKPAPDAAGATGRSGADSDDPRRSGYLAKIARAITATARQGLAAAVWDSLAEGRSVYLHLSTRGAKIVNKPEDGGINEPLYPGGHITQIGRPDWTIGQQLVLASGVVTDMHRLVVFYAGGGVL